ncbi:MAG: NlpC/P60 family protein [Blautia sp.]|nr:NlpC/P60 family protein [Blautia sp.]MDD7371538.1 NlpC/P60 family protein [Bacillota bacterium]MDY3716497.1 NlpC/P60 family protein [Blautia sp.]
MKKRFLCLSLIFAMTAAQVMPVAAARKDEVQAEKAETQSKLAQAESKADDLEAKKNALLNEIDSIDKSLVQTIAQIDILKGEISDKEDAITETKEKLEEAEAEKETQYESMKKRIQYLYENGGTKAWAQMLLESGNILDMVGKAEYTEKMYQYDRDELKKMKEVVTQVTDLGNQLTQEKAELEDMKQVQEEQQETLETQLAQKKATASDYESQIASVEAQAQEYRNLIEQQNAELQKIQEEEARAAEAARKAQEAAEKARQEAAQNQTQAVESTDNTATEEVQTSTGSSSNENSNSSTSTESSSEPVEEETTSNSGSSYSATGEAVVAYASQFIGNPYVYGGNSLTNGIDCSGFVQQVFAHFGYSLPRVSDAQAGAGRGISYSESRAGDIIVYSGHVAILTGDGGIVHASNSAPYPQGGIKYSSNALYRPYIAVRRIVE